ncbi:MAG: UbiA family prenyltransferase [Verrucomicrobiales bacterium]|nr:UbiA family prenyltransferase [Verrucomicrobiales bacterium]
MGFLRTLLILGRVSNLPTIWTNVAVGWFLSGGGWTGELGWIAAGISILYIAGMTTNDAFDARWDSENAPDRPIPAGRISHQTVWVVGGIEFLVGIGILLTRTTFHPLLLGGLVFSILLYNAIHKHWKGSVLVMGLCRAFVYLGAGSAVVVQTNAIEVPGILSVVSGAVILYIAGITLAARNEHLQVPTGTTYLNRLLLMLPVLFPLFGGRTVPTSPLSTALVVVGIFGIWAWLVIARKALSEKTPKGIAFLIAGIAFFDAAIVAFADWRAGVICLVCFGLTLAAQRVIPAT